MYSGEMLASAGDDGMIFLYKLSQKSDHSTSFGEENQENKEHWTRIKALR